MPNDSGVCLELKLHWHVKSAKNKEKLTVTFGSLSGTKSREILTKQHEICCGECNRPFNGQFNEEPFLGAQWHCFTF